MSNRIEDWLTHIDNPEDRPYLKSKLFDVNIRLFRSNIHYRSLVQSACRLIEHRCLTKMEGYKLPHGTSGANLAIPWNIIATARHRGTPRANALVMINPKIIIKGSGGPKVETTTNCGSIRLDEPIKVMRFEYIEVDYFLPSGTGITGEIFGPDQGSFTIQHEVDHNNGILITDRQIK